MSQRYKRIAEALSQHAGNPLTEILHEKAKQLVDEKPRAPQKSRGRRRSAQSEFRDAFSPDTIFKHHYWGFDDPYDDFQGYNGF